MITGFCFWINTFGIPYIFFWVWVDCSFFSVVICQCAWMHKDSSIDYLTKMPSSVGCHRSFLWHRSLDVCTDSTKGLQKWVWMRMQQTTQSPILGFVLDILPFKPKLMGSEMQGRVTEETNTLLWFCDWGRCLVREKVLGTISGIYNFKRISWNRY